VLVYIVVAPLGKWNTSIFQADDIRFLCTSDIVPKPNGDAASLAAIMVGAAQGLDHGRAKCTVIFHAVLVLLLTVNTTTAKPTCLELMHQQGPPDEWLKTLTPRSRQLPDVSRLDLGSTDWVGPVSWVSKGSRNSKASPKHGPPEKLQCKDGRGVLRYKVHGPPGTMLAGLLFA
jgi:hypothetical protein